MSLTKDLRERETKTEVEQSLPDLHNNNLPQNLSSYFNMIPETLKTCDSIQPHLQRQK